MGQGDKFEEIDVGQVKIIRLSGAAMLVESLGDGPREAWIPFSQIKDGSDLTRDSDEGDEGTLVIPQWLASEKGFT